MFKNWDGYDYYDEEYIKGNFTLHWLDNNYPSIDHKISVLNGFINDVDVNIIGGIQNLCITKRVLNSRKNHKNEKIFINEMKYQKYKL